MSLVPAEPVDVHGEFLAAQAALTGRSGGADDAPAGRRARDDGPVRPVTSDLSIDEALLLHSIGWEAVDLATGAAVWRLPYAGGNWGRSGGELPGIWEGYSAALSAAIQRMGTEAHRAGGHGVVGVHIDGDVRPGLAEIQVVGTAVRPVIDPAAGGRDALSAGVPFVSDLSARDFVLLLRAGWFPLGLAYGASFVYAPRRSAGDALRQSTQNVELENLTDAMYQARELAMARMQETAQALGADGVVAVSVAEGPIRGISHTIRFSTLGTAVHLREGNHRQLSPKMVVSMDDASLLFSAESLR